MRRRIPDGRGRRCATPTKTAYRTEAEAERALANILRDVELGLDVRGKTPRRTYQCGCGRWHLTSMERNGRPSVQPRDRDAPHRNDVPGCALCQLGEHDEGGE